MATNKIIKFLEHKIYRSTMFSKFSVVHFISIILLHVDLINKLGLSELDAHFKKIVGIIYVFEARTENMFTMSFIGLLPHDEHLCLTLW